MHQGIQFDLYAQLLNPKTEGHTEAAAAARNHERSLRPVTWSVISRRFRTTSDELGEDDQLAKKFLHTQVGRALAELCIQREREHYVECLPEALAEISPESILAESRDETCAWPVQKAWQIAATDFEYLASECFHVDSAMEKVQVVNSSNEIPLSKQTAFQRGKLFDLRVLDRQWERFDSGSPQNGDADFPLIVQDVNGRILHYLSQPLRTTAIDVALLRWGLAAEYFGFLESQKFKQENPLQKEKPPQSPAAWAYGLFAAIASLLALFVFWIDAAMGLSGFAAVPFGAFLAVFTLTAVVNDFVAQSRVLAGHVRLRLGLRDLHTFAGYSDENPQRVSAMLREPQAAGVVVSSPVWALIADVEKREVTLL